jgi:transposase
MTTISQNRTHKGLEGWSPVAVSSARRGGATSPEECTGRRREIGRPRCLGDAGKSGCTHSTDMGSAHGVLLQAFLHESRNRPAPTYRSQSNGTAGWLVQVVRTPARRWKVERLFAWLHNFRRLVTRWEFHVENFLGFVQLACVIMLLRHL